MGEGGNLLQKRGAAGEQREESLHFATRLASVLYRHQSCLISTTQLYLRTKTFIQRHGSSGMCVPGWTIVLREVAQRSVRRIRGLITLLTFWSVL